MIGKSDHLQLLDGSGFVLSPSAKILEIYVQLCVIYRLYIMSDHHGIWNESIGACKFEVYLPLKMLCLHMICWFLLGPLLFGGMLDISILN
jgi:hypothetical protein